MPINTDIDMQGVDTIVAIPQWYVNFNLSQLLQTGRTTDGKSLKTIELDLGKKVTWLKATVASLTANFHVVGSVTKVQFVISFASGTMDYYDIKEVPPKKCSADVTGLSFGFQVDLSFEDLEHDQDIPANVKAQIEKRMKNLGAGAYTIQQFFMDLTESAVAVPDPTVTVFPDNFPASAKAALPTYLSTYVDLIRKAGGHVLGYGVRIQNPGDLTDPTASFPPSKLEFVTNQYQPPSHEHSDLNTINYLMMTGANSSFPANLKPWWGNFAQPGDDASGVDGVIAVRSENIRDFLLEKLAPVVCTYVAVEDQSDDLGLATSSGVGALLPAALGGTFQASSYGKSHKTWAVSNDDAVYSFSFEVNVTIDAGSNTIVIHRKTDFSTKLTHWYGLEGHAISKEFEIEFEIPVTYTITLEGISDGALQVDVKEQKKEQPPNYVSSMDYGWLVTKTEGSIPWFMSSNLWDKWHDIITSAVNTAYPAAVPTNMKKAIADSLNIAPFVFPGGAQLFMKDPVFSKTGDLLAGLQYKS